MGVFSFGNGLRQQKSRLTAAKQDTANKTYSPGNKPMAAVIQTCFARNLQDPSAKRACSGNMKTGFKSVSLPFPSSFGVFLNLITDKAKYQGRLRIKKPPSNYIAGKKLHSIP